MNSQTASALRTLLTLLGAYLVGNSIFGVPFTSETIEIVVGGAFAGISVLVGVFTKSNPNSYRHDYFYWGCSICSNATAPTDRKSVG